MKTGSFRPLAIFKRLTIAYALICLFMWGFQRHLLYLPQTNIQPPAAYGLQNFSVLPLKSSDGTQVTAWYHSAKPGYPTLIYFHGNGGHLGNRANYFALLTDTGYGMLALDYRGYGTSAGSPSEAGFYQDARAMMDYAIKTLALPPSQLIIYGESIGTGVAVQMATEYPSAALVLQSPFTSIEALAEDNYPWLPVKFLLEDRFDSLNKITHIHTPLLLFHGDRDNVVPIQYGKMLYAAAPEPKEAVYYPHKGHLNLDIHQLTEKLIAFSHDHNLIQ